MRDSIKKILKEYEEEEKILNIPSLKFFNNDWNTLQKFLQLKGNPLYSIGGYLNLGYTSIKSLGNLTSVNGNLYLYNTPMYKKYSEQEIRQMVNVDGDIYI